jgi:uncharacterized protein YlbG (UPF0298 family)
MISESRRVHGIYCPQRYARLFFLTTQRPSKVYPPPTLPRLRLPEEQLNTESEDDSEDEEEALNRIIRSYKATRNLNRFGGMVRTSNRDVHVSVDMGKVRALMSKLDKEEIVALSDGGCDTTLLGAGWYILEYTGRSTDIVGFDKFVARKTGLPIVTGITKVTLPNLKGCILLRSHESVYNKGS